MDNSFLVPRPLKMRYFVISVRCALIGKTYLESLDRDASRSLVKVLTTYMIIDWVRMYVCMWLIVVLLYAAEVVDS